MKPTQITLDGSLRLAFAIAAKQYLERTFAVRRSVIANACWRSRAQQVAMTRRNWCCWKWKVAYSTGFSWRRWWRTWDWKCYWSRPRSWRTMSSAARWPSWPPEPSSHFQSVIRPLHPLMLRRPPAMIQLARPRRLTADLNVSRRNFNAGVKSSGKRRPQKK